MNRAPKFRIPMPWRGVYYTLNWDEMRLGRRWFAVCWWTEFGVFHFVAGWTFTFVPPSYAAKTKGDAT